MAGKKGIEASKHLRERTKAQRGGQTRHGDDWQRGEFDSLARWQDDYLQNLAVRNHAEGTIEGRRFALKTFIDWCHERELVKASAITRPILESYQAWLWRYRTKADKPLGISTQRDKLGTLKSYFAWLVRQSVIDANPASELELPRREKRLHEEALTPTQVEHIMAVPNIADPLGLRDRAMLEVFYATAIRRAELTRLEVSDIHTERRTLRVRKGKGGKDRVVPIGERAAHWLARYCAEVRPRLLVKVHEQALFLTSYGEAFNPDVLSRQVAATFKKAGLARSGSCHLLRHTCATHMLEGGADIRFIQQLLGHEKLETTAIYTEVTITQLQLVHERCHPASKLAVTGDESTPNTATATDGEPTTTTGS
jgi:integrase/recombinase XerD